MDAQLQPHKVSHNVIDTEMMASWLTIEVAKESVSVLLFFFFASSFPVQVLMKSFVVGKQWIYV